MKIRQIAATLLVVLGMLAVAAASATAAPGGKPGKPPKPGDEPPPPPETTANQVDIEFTEMMIPHHFQALVMSELAPSRSNDDAVVALADRIHLEQRLEIMSMQGWQGRNGLPVTDAEAAYQELLGMPDMLEQMGMATQAELDQLSASQGTAFDVGYLELMIEHHEGAVRMLENVIADGSDLELQQLALDMLTTQRVQIYDMQQLLADKTS